MAEKINTGGIKEFVSSDKNLSELEPEREEAIEKGYEKYRKRKKKEKIIKISTIAIILLMILIYFLVR